MLIKAFLQWWYGPGWKQQIFNLEARTRNIGSMFSIGILVKTMFSPWKQIVSYTRPDQGLSLQIRASLDNLVSRFVGFWVRSVVLLTAGLCMAFVSVMGTLAVILWPFVPLLPIMLIIVGVS